MNQDSFDFLLHEILHSSSLKYVSRKLNKNSVESVIANKQDLKSKQIRRNCYFNPIVANKIIENDIWLRF